MDEQEMEYMENANIPFVDGFFLTLGKNVDAHLRIHGCNPAPHKHLRYSRLDAFAVNRQITYQ